MTTIALDAMGGDHGVEKPVEGAAAASLGKYAPNLVLVGDQELIRRGLDAHEHDPTRIEIVHASEAIPMDCNPKLACDELQDASVRRAAQIVHSGDADVLVSGGNTGAVVLTCARTFGRLPGVNRTALGAVFPTERRRGEKNDPFSLILDAGLTVEPQARDLVCFAVMGSAYAKRISSNDQPKVALLSNGTESNKGTRAIVGAHTMLALLARTTFNPDLMKDDDQRRREQLNFIGNIEGMDIPRGTADVVVTGGFTGNIVLKMLEGVADTVKNLGRYAMKQNIAFKAGLALLSPGLKQLKRVTDWRQYGGAPVLGFDRMCIKAHGRSEGRAFKNAIRVAQKTVRTEMTENIAAALRLVDWDAIDDLDVKKK